jgi:hypothetical protein
MTTNQVEIIITAPNGCDSALELLKCLDKQISSGFKVTVLEAVGNCSVDSFTLSNFPLEHMIFANHEEALMRRDGFLKSRTDWVLVLEDHVLISDNFISEFQRFIENSGDTAATTFYAVNGTAGTFGSRALFSWVWGLAETSRYPEKPEPVCSAFAVKRLSVVNLLKKLGKELEVGELETQIIPGIINSSSSQFMTHMEISHFEYVGIRVGAKAIYSNSRIMGHLESSLQSRRSWLKHLMHRYSSRPGQIQKVSPKSFIELAFLYYLAMVGFSGFLIGGFFGIGKADLHLASAHPKIMKE